jgi:hypothetical protein
MFGGAFRERGWEAMFPKHGTKKTLPQTLNPTLLGVALGDAAGDVLTN